MIPVYFLFVSLCLGNPSFLNLQQIIKYNLYNDMFEFVYDKDFCILEISDRKITEIKYIEGCHSQDEIIKELEYDNMKSLLLQISSIIFDCTSNQLKDKINTILSEEKKDVFFYSNADNKKNNKSRKIVNLYFTHHLSEIYTLLKDYLERIAEDFTDCITLNILKPLEVLALNMVSSVALIENRNSYKLIFKDEKKDAKISRLITIIDFSTLNFDFMIAKIIQLEVFKPIIRICEKERLTQKNFDFLVSNLFNSSLITRRNFEFDNLKRFRTHYSAFLPAVKIILVEDKLTHMDCLVEKIIDENHSSLHILKKGSSSDFFNRLVSSCHELPAVHFFSLLLIFELMKNSHITGHMIQKYIKEEWFQVILYYLKISSILQEQDKNSIWHAVQENDFFCYLFNKDELLSFKKTDYLYLCNLKLFITLFFFELQAFYNTLDIPVILNCVFIIFFENFDIVESIRNECFDLLKDEALLSVEKLSNKSIFKQKRNMLFNNKINLS